MSEGSINIPGSAITTWNGFLYQGQLAILHSLKLINENYDINYCLQLDSLEDFAIVEKKDDTLNPISLHQVKGLKCNTYGGYTTALRKLNSKSDECPNLFFHTARRITNKTIEGIEEDYSNVKMYQYTNGDYHCELSEIQGKLQEICKQLYSKYFPNEIYKTRDEYLIRTIHYLTHIIMKAINEVHTDTHNGLGSDDELAYMKTISFMEFKDIFELDLNAIGDNSEYYKMMALEDFQRYYESFCHEFESKIQDIELEKLFGYVSEIMTFNNTEMELFIKGVAPHREFKFDTIQDYKDGGLQKDEMEHVFFNILKEIREGTFCNSQIQWKCINGNCYRPTSINAPERVKESICARIVKNAIDSDVHLIFEGGTLITEYLQSNSVFCDAGELLDIDDYNDKHILRAKKMRLEKVGEAKEVLNEDKN